MFRLLSNGIKLAACVGELFLRLIERVLLHEHSLSEDVERIRITSQGLLQKLLGVRILLLKLGAVDALSEVLKHLLFLRGHETPLQVMTFRAESMTRIKRKGRQWKRVDSLKLKGL